MASCAGFLVLGMLLVLCSELLAFLGGYLCLDVCFDLVGFGDGIFVGQLESPSVECFFSAWW